MITDFNVFRKKHSLEPDVKIFIVVGGYGTLRKALLERGWYENPDRYSPVFDLKFAIRNDNPIELKEFQITNHFAKNNVITTKVGISYSLKQLLWWTPVDVDAFFPKCFDLTDGNELEDFKQEYRFQRAESILKSYLVNPEA
jgi:tubulin monoglycylase TTLL3/8